MEKIFPHRSVLGEIIRINNSVSFFWDEEKDKISKCIVEKPKMVPTLTSKLGGFNLQIEEEKIF